MVLRRKVALSLVLLIMGVSAETPVKADAVTQQTPTAVQSPAEAEEKEDPAQIEKEEKEAITGPLLSKVEEELKGAATPEGTNEALLEEEESLDEAEHSEEEDQESTEVEGEEEGEEEASMLEEEIAEEEEEEEETEEEETAEAEAEDQEQLLTKEEEELQEKYEIQDINDVLMERDFVAEDEHGNGEYDLEKKTEDEQEGRGEHDVEKKTDKNLTTR